MLAILRRSVMLCLALAAHSALATAPLPPTSTAAAPDLQLTFPEIRRQLASSSFSQREAGQKLLDALPPSQLDSLRDLAKSESDPEVQARLDNRINSLELYILTHPPAISLHVQNATLVDICTKFSEQLGGDVKFLATTPTSRTGGGAKTPTYSLQTDNLPLWDTILQLQRQTPFAVSASTTISAAGYRSSIHLTAVAATATPPDYRLVDSFLVNPQVSGTPSTGTWSLRLTFNADPRVRITHYSSQLRITKITNQDGASLLPLVISSSPSMSSLSRPSSAWSSSVSLSVSGNAKSIKELRAVVDLAVLEKECTVTVDLTKPAPFETPRGTLTIDQNPAGNSVIRITAPAITTPAAAGPATPRYSTLRILDQNGQALTTSIFSGTQITLGINAANRVPTKAELTWTESSRPFTLPLELHDIPIPEPAPARKPANPIPLPVDRLLLD